VLKARQTGMLIESPMNVAEPSQNATFTPPGWLLREPYIPPGKALCGPVQGGFPSNKDRHHADE
jgi:hypothetical protein